MIFVKKIYFKIFTLFIFSAVLTNFVFAQSDFKENIFFKNLYSFNISKSQNFIKNSETDKNSENKNLAKAYYYSFLNDIEPNEIYADSAAFISEEIIDKISDKTIFSYNDYFNIIAAQAVLFKSGLKNGNFYNAFINFIKTDNFLKYILKNYNETDKFRFVSGVYLYYAQLAKSDYPALYPVLLFYPKGNKQKGLNLLKQTASSENIFIRTESTYFLAIIYRRDEKIFSLSDKYFKILLNEYPKNLMWRYEYAECLKYFAKYDDLILQKQIFAVYIKNDSNLSISQKKYLLKKINEL